MGQGMDFVQSCNGLRATIQNVITEVREEIKLVKESETDGTQDHGEMIANLTLALRHLEDARMRIGKGIQAHDGGKSVYDK